MTDESGRRLVHKRLPDDCCPRGQLHPSIQLRLQRLRELPLGSFVNLIGVERTANGIVMVSEYVVGTPLDQLPQDQISRFARDVRLAVMSMHQHGLVHGAIKPSNIIIEPAGTIRLIDPSPFLHDDPAIDLKAVNQLSPAVSAGVIAKAESNEDEHDRQYRQRTIVIAVAIAVAAIIVAVVLAYNSGA